MSTLKNSYREQIEQWETPAKPSKPTPRPEGYGSGLMGGLFLGIVLTRLAMLPLTTPVTIKVAPPRTPVFARGRGIEPTVMRASFDISYVKTCEDGFKKVYINFNQEVCIQNEVVEEVRRESNVEDRRHETHADTSLHQ